jgi:hypothetical protein
MLHADRVLQNLKIRNLNPKCKIQDKHTIMGKRSKHIKALRGNVDTVHEMALIVVSQLLQLR